jgi:hypothetical protein
VMFNRIEGRKMATVRDRNGQTYKAPVFLVRISPSLSPIFRSMTMSKERSRLTC